MNSSLEKQILKILNEHYKDKFVSLKNIQRCFEDIKDINKNNVLRAVKKLNARSQLQKKYWIIRGYSEEEATEKIKEIQRKRALKIKEKYSPEERKEIFNIKNQLKKKYGQNWRKYYDIWLEKCRKNSPNNINKYLEEGYSEEEAKKKVKEFNSFVAKKGWENRNQNGNGTRITINNLEWWLSKYKDENIALKEYIKFQSTRSEIKNLKEDEIIEYYVTLYKNKFTYKKPEKFYYANTQKFFKHIIDVDKFCEKIQEFYDPKIIYTRKGIKKDVDEGVLKSSHEIYFYNLLKENNIEFILEKRYPNSRKFCDFYIPSLDLYIEIAGLAGDYEYDALMNYKMIKYNADIVLPKNISVYFQKLIERINNETNNT